MKSIITGVCTGVARQISVSLAANTIKKFEDTTTTYVDFLCGYVFRRKTRNGPVSRPWFCEETYHISYQSNHQTNGSLEM